MRRSQGKRYCPICGQEPKDDELLVPIDNSCVGLKQHRCKSSNKRDAAMMSDRHQNYTPTYGERLRDGFAMMGDE